MTVLAGVLVAVVALLHVGFAYLEMVAWKTPRGLQRRHARRSNPHEAFDAWPRQPAGCRAYHISALLSQLYPDRV